MSLEQIEYFVAVAEEGHLTRAALRLHISQPPLTRQIQRLEHEVGRPLFQRTPRGMRLLPAGEQFLVHARRVLEAVQAARRAVAEQPPSPPEDVGSSDEVRSDHETVCRRQPACRDQRND